MAFLDKLLKRPAESAPLPQAETEAAAIAVEDGTTPADGKAEGKAEGKEVARYLYILRHASAEELEQAHESAFEQFSPEQRRAVLQQLGQVVPHHEYSRMRDNPHSLALAATRAETQQPGTLQRAFSGSSRGGGIPVLTTGAVLNTLAQAFVHTELARDFFSIAENEADFQQSSEAEATDQN